MSFKGPSVSVSYECNKHLSFLLDSLLDIYIHLSGAIYSSDLVYTKRSHSLVLYKSMFLMF